MTCRERWLPAKKEGTFEPANWQAAPLLASRRCGGMYFDPAHRVEVRGVTQRIPVWRKNQKLKRLSDLDSPEDVQRRKAEAFDWLAKRAITGCEYEIQGLKAPGTWQLRWWFKQEGYRVTNGHATLLDAIEHARRQERSND